MCLVSAVYNQPLTQYWQNIDSREYGNNKYNVLCPLTCAVIAYDVAYNPADTVLSYSFGYAQE